MRQELGRENTVFVHLTLVPWIAAAQELKTKPTQHSVKELLSIGIQADILLCRSDRALRREIKQKIAAFCNVEEKAVIGATTVPFIYEVPLGFAQEGVDALILKYLHIEAPEADLTQVAGARRPLLPPQRRSLHRHRRQVCRVRGQLQVAQGSPHPRRDLAEPQAQGPLDRGRRPGVGQSPEDRSYESQFEGFDGILVPGGFGKRGIEGMLNAIRYAREKNVPYFGICLGMQTACIEFARNVCGLKDANSSEFDPATQHRIIYKLRELLGVEEMGGTMRLGAWTCNLQADSLAAAPTAAQTRSASATATATNSTASTRPCSPAPACASAGATPDQTYVEIVEIPGHPYFLGCQFHPEFKSKPLEPHPLFREFIAASYKNRLAANANRKSIADEVIQ